MNSFFAYTGGKSLLTGKIIPLMPEHKCYVEVFAGAAWMLFRKPNSDVEIINDINKELVTLYRCVKLHLKEFIRYFEWVLTARDEYERLKAENPDSLTDIQKAARFFYLLRNNFGGKVDRSNFTPCTTRPPKINLYRLEEALSEIHLRLSGVYVENLNYDALIQKYDRPHTFFYLDPPYWNCEDYYGKGIFNKADYTRLNELLGGIKGKFIMSINDTPEIREMFANFNIKEVETRYSIEKSRDKVTELLIMNY
jgi:DNA adenine methylase